MVTVYAFVCIYSRTDTVCISVHAKRSQRPFAVCIIDVWLHVGSDGDVGFDRRNALLMAWDKYVRCFAVACVIHIYLRIMNRLDSHFVLTTCGGVSLYLSAFLFCSLSRGQRWARRVAPSTQRSRI